MICGPLTWTNHAFNWKFSNSTYLFYVLIVVIEFENTLINLVTTGCLNYVQKGAECNCTLYIILQCIVHGLGWHYQSLFHWIQWTSFPNIRKEGEFGAVLNNVKTVSLNVYEKVFMELEFIHWKLRWHGVAFVFWKRNSKKRFRIF